MQKNSTIMFHAWLEGSNDYAERMPAPDQATMAETVNALFAPLNGRVYSSFVDTLINRIGDTIVHQREWENPLAVFKGSKLNYGATVQEIANKWLQAHSYDDEAVADVLKMSRPMSEVCYHSMNSQRRYDITVNRDELRQAFAEEYGLNNYVNSLLTVPINSDNYDEYRAMLELIAFYDEKLGFFKVAAPTLADLMDATKEPGAGQQLLALIRTYIELFKFPSTLYNAQIVEGVPVFEKDVSKIVLICTPSVKASLDVFTLSQLFHVDRAEVDSRIVVVDELPVDNAVAILTTEDFFIAKDVEYTTTSYFNAATLSQNYFLHHWQVLSVSPFVPAVLFTTEDTETPSRIYAATDFEISLDDPAIVDGKYVQLSPVLTGTIDGAEAEIPPVSSTVWEIVAASQSTIGPEPVSTDIVLNSRTYVDRFNRLHLQRSGWYRNAADGTATKTNTITLKGTSSYVNPSGATATLEDTIAITLTFDNEGNLIAAEV